LTLPEPGTAGAWEMGNDLEVFGQFYGSRTGRALFVDRSSISKPFKTALRGALLCY